MGPVDESAVHGLCRWKAAADVRQPASGAVVTVPAGGGAEAVVLTLVRKGRIVPNTKERRLKMCRPAR